MSFSDAPLSSVWGRASLAAGLFAIDPVGAGGIALRARAGPVRDAFIALVRQLLDPAAPVRRIPLNASDDRLLGGLDLAATLNAGRAILEKGLLADVNGGVAILLSAERLDSNKAARLTSTLDTGRAVLERDGFSMASPANFGVIAIDEGQADDERPLPALLDRLAFSFELEGLRARDALVPEGLHTAVIDARARLAGITVEDAWIEAICQATVSLGIASARAPLLAIKIARASAALEGRLAVNETDIKIAAQFVLAPRATRLPPEEAEEDESDPPPPEPEAQEPPPPQDEELDEQKALEALDNIVLDATTAAIPAGLLEKLRTDAASRARAQSSGHAGAMHASKLRGRPAGVRAGKPADGARLNVVETLRCAAPWQTLRRQERERRGLPPHATRRVEVRSGDFRITRYKERAETTTIFVVDASGSSALHRLGEAKGAVELLLADCYVRRDSVALIAFRGKAAELLLPPTRSLTRAKRALIGLPGGGGTPLASAIAETVELAIALKRKGQTPTVVLLTDGRANIARDGRASRELAETDALDAARALKASGVTSLLIDTFPQRQPKAERIAGAMGATYLPLPYANANILSQAIRATNSGQRGRS